ncbi:carboxypeptidase-like regulatory domain-containing protein [Thermonema rossianum]|uniref:carboxypeptidase-like regulatory domain-containing protein n=1 Tax=Thermonema rossianum TaxID=55505 RepID=UPI00056F83C3|nr:carboxypeptidase-like regulatory domain-containing protein [Thermonema rossianum]
MKKYIAVFLLLLCFFWGAMPTYAQQVRIQGQVIDTLTREPVVGAYVLLSDSSGAKQYAYTVSDENGYFEMSAEQQAEGGYWFWVMSIGYEEYRARWDGKFFVQLRLQPKNYELEEVVVEGEKYPVKIVGDSAIFRSEDYRDSTELTVADVLNKLPDVKVEAGKIYYRGKLVENVYLEGDNLTGSYYEQLINSISADLVEEFHFVDRFEEEEVLRGITTSNKLILNLKISERFLHTWTGSVQAHAGNDWRRKINASMFYIRQRRGGVQEGAGKKYDKYFNLLHHNSLGETASSQFGGYDYRDNFLYVQQPFTQSATEFYGMSIPYIFPNTTGGSVVSDNIGLVKYLNDSSKVILSGFGYYNDLGYPFTYSSDFRANDIRFSTESRDDIRQYRGSIAGRFLYENTLSPTTSIKWRSLLNRHQFDNRFSNLYFIDGQANDSLSRRSLLQHQGQEHSLKWAKRLHKRHGLEMNLYYQSGQMVDEMQVDGIFDRYGAWRETAEALSRARQQLRIEEERMEGNILWHFKAARRDSRRQLGIWYNRHTQRLVPRLYFLNDDRQTGDSLSYSPPYSLQKQQWMAQTEWMAGGKRLKAFWQLQAGFEQATQVDTFRTRYTNITGRLTMSQNIDLRSRKQNKNKGKTTLILTQKWERFTPDLATVASPLWMREFRSVRTGGAPFRIVNRYGGDVQLETHYRLKIALGGQYQDHTYAQQFLPSPVLSLYNHVLLDDSYQWKTSIDLPAWYMDFLLAGLAVKANYFQTTGRNRLAEDDRWWQSEQWSVSAALRSAFFGFFNYRLSADRRQTRTLVRSASTGAFRNENLIHHLQLDTYFDFFDKRLRVELQQHWLQFNDSPGSYYIDFEATCYWHPKRKFPVWIEGRNLTNLSGIEIRSVSDTGSSSALYWVMPVYVTIGTQWNF